MKSGANLFHRFGLVIAFCFCTMLLAGCPKPWPKCDGDKDCAATKAGNTAQKSFFCVNGSCLECKDNSHCGANQKCDGNRCVQKTCADVTCTDGKRCNESTLKCEWICENDGDSPCDGDRCKVCKSHQCVAKPSKCSNDSDCPGNQICQSPGTCDAQCVGGCSATKPCPAGQNCANGQCVQDTCDLAKIHFDYNRSFIRNDAKSTLKANLECIQKMKTRKVLIEGHCDERGTVEYNVQLGKRRAQQTKKFLSRLGVDSSRLCTVSKGKESPEVPNASSDSDHQKNRRSVFSFVETCP